MSEGKKMIVSKGYTVEVESWENDGDNPRTKSVTYQNKEYALAVLQMCKDIFVSCNNGDGGIGNMNDCEDPESIIINYLKDKLILNKGITDEDSCIDMVMDINYSVMGSSEYYYSRVFESGVIYYSPKDIFVETLK